MFIDLGKDQPVAIPSADVARVGAGPAGPTLAGRLEELGRDVLLIESGALEYSEAAPQLNSRDDSR